MSLNLDTTPEYNYLSRRRFMRLTAARAAQLACLSSTLPLAPAIWAAQNIDGAASADLLQQTGDGKRCQTNLTVKHDELTPFKSITRYNNYYEFSTEKKAVFILARELTLEPWSIEVSGLIDHPKTFSLKDIIALGAVDRVYHLRCVEGWSMVIPWSGVPLCRLLEAVKPKASARFVKFTGVLRPEEMIGQRRPTLEWPYVEGLRIDEARHPLTLLATGLYEKDLPPQNGAPLRLVVPWKYGFKSIKAVQHIEFVEQQPETSWMQLAPSEYGFYANVNPAVAHPRWSQRKEVRIGETKKRRTLPFNGYADQVAHLYKGMDLSKHF